MLALSAFSTHRMALLSHVGNVGSVFVSITVGSTTVNLRVSFALHSLLVRLAQHATVCSTDPWRLHLLLSSVVVLHQHQLRALSPPRSCRDARNRGSRLAYHHPGNRTSVSEASRTFTCDSRSCISFCYPLRSARAPLESPFLASSPALCTPHIAFLFPPLHSCFKARHNSTRPIERHTCYCTTFDFYHRDSRSTYHRPIRIILNSDEAIAGEGTVWRNPSSTLLFHPSSSQHRTALIDCQSML